MKESAPFFRKPSPPERLLNRLFATLVGFGFGLSHNFLLQVRGRKSGRVYSTPVNLLVMNDRKYLVAPRGNTEWVRNARSQGEIWLKKGRQRERFRIRELPDMEKPPLLKAYLDQYRITVQRYFPLSAGSELEAFLPITSRYPVFVLEPPTPSPSAKATAVPGR